MTDKKEIATAVVHEKEGWSIYWLLPIIAVLIAGWLVYKNLVEGDIEIQVSLDSATGIVEGKTELKYQGITIGILESYEIDISDFEGIEATLKVKRFAEPLLTESSQIWLVKPEVNFSGVSGLEALVSGNYFELLYKEGKPARSYNALDNPPVLARGEGGLELTLMSDRLGSIVRGAPVMYRRIEVGEVLDYQFNEDFKKVAIKVFIKPEYKDVITSNTRFWESSGLSLSGDLSGIKLQVDSLASLIIGGISLDTPKNTLDTESKTVGNGDQFTLYDDYEAAHTGIIVQVKFKTAKGLKPGSTEVQYKGVTVGKVIDVKPTPELDGMIASISMDPRSEPVLNDRMKFWIPKTVVSLTEISGLESIVGGGVIEVDASLEGKPQRRFVALEDAPKKDRNVPGLHITLKSDSLKSIDRGTDILYRNIPIGNVEGYELAKDQSSVLIDVFILPEYEHLVRKKSRFWNAGGIEIRGGLQGLQINAPSVKTILSGGIELYTPEVGLKAKAKDGDTFTLHNTYEAAYSDGIQITIAFNDGEGLKEGTQIRYLGIEVGKVKSVQLNKKMNGVITDVELYPSAEQIAREGSEFWLVKPEIGLVKTANLGTLVTGNYINVRPGAGKLKFAFEATTQRPSQEAMDQGLNVVLLTEQLGSIKEGVQVLYRGIPIGKVTTYGLSDTANQVHVFVNIESKYAPLVKQNSVFWNISGIGFDFSLFGGAQVKTSSLESILEGGIMMATPPESIMGRDAKSGDQYPLHSEQRDKWLEWAPKIPLEQ
ncbi:intermembrane transport protein PqiB [Litoribrevibacter euphylliae]|uniref:Intermembrane transport protein PqiB n=1 Tax=Litoribrevibacter euphylliae TaxID=1834034 RepID=A0ABV7HDC2_9GAMM